MDQKLKDKITDSLKMEHILAIINSDPFYFQKAQDVLSEFLNLKVDLNLKTFLLKNKKQYDELKQLFEDSEEFAEFGRLVFTLVSYCDLKALRKNELNQYEDTRVLAAAAVRMNNWVEQLITYKFEGLLTNGSIKNAIEYLITPEDNFTMLSENHRSQISENLFKKEYRSSSFKKEFLNFFSEFSINVRNPKNYTHVLSRICYEFDNEWKESVIGLISPDGTGWQENTVKETVNGNHVVLWNHKKPNGTAKTLKLLKQCIEENGFFRVFYTSAFNVRYVAEIVDFATSQNELDKSKWVENFGSIPSFTNSFSGYSDGSKSASWIYLARKIYKTESIPSSNFEYLKPFDYPSVGCQAPVISLKTSTEIKKEKLMNDNIQLLEYKKQIILQGPPGTGKTYTAKDIAYKMIFNQDISQVEEARKEQLKQLESSEQFKLVQFHPSYSYEDFVRGITAKSQEGIIEYITENKVLAKFAEKASENSENNRKNANVLSKELWFKEKLREYSLTVNNEIDKTGRYVLNNSKSYIRKALNDRFYYYNEDYIPNSVGFDITFKEFRRIFLETPFDSDYETVQLPAHNLHRKLLIPLLQDFRKFITDIPDNFEEGTEKIELVNYVLIIDEINRANLPSVLGELIYALEYRGEKVGSMYEIDDDNSVVIPPNLYIIGTMNTADRSVGYIDYAIRRRFAFVDVLPDASVIMYAYAKALFEEIATLFNSKDTLASDFKAEQVQLGHSYFMVNDEAEFQLKAKYEIVPILEEYLKDGILLEKAEEKIKELKERFGN